MAATTTPTPTPTPSDEVLENIDNLSDAGGGIEIIPETEEDVPPPQVTPTETDEVVAPGRAEAEQSIDDPLARLEVTQYEMVPDENTSTAKITYTDDDGLIYKRDINVPKNKDGSINQEYLDEILYSQLLGVNNKRAIGVAVFKDASEYEEASDSEEGSTGEEAPA